MCPCSMLRPQSLYRLVLRMIRMNSSLLISPSPSVSLVNHLLHNNKRSTCLSMSTIPCDPKHLYLVVSQVLAQLLRHSL